MSKNIIVFCPNPYSLYTNSLCELLIKKGYHIECIVVRKFSTNRFFSEFSRDGFRLIRKIWFKLILKEKYLSIDSEFATFRKTHSLTVKAIKVFKEKYGTKIVVCDTLNDKIVEDTLKLYDNKFVLFTGGGIIRDHIIKNAGDGVVNCHMGILPEYKGMDLPEWCILENNINLLGFTVHFMDCGLDTGDILHIGRINLKKYVDIKKLRDSYQVPMINAMVEMAEKIINNNYQTYKQKVDPLRRQYFMVHTRLYKLLNTKLKNNNQKYV